MERQNNSITDLTAQAIAVQTRHKYPELVGMRVEVGKYASLARSTTTHSILATQSLRGLLEYLMSITLLILTDGALSELSQPACKKPRLTVRYPARARYFAGCYGELKNALFATCNKKKLCPIRVLTLPPQ